jgi:CheY-like chemotaxis protein
MLIFVGKEAVDKIFRENVETGEIVVNYYELVMMDNFMPNMDGMSAYGCINTFDYSYT